MNKEALSGIEASAENMKHVQKLVQMVGMMLDCEREEEGDDSSSEDSKDHYDRF